MKTWKIVALSSMGTGLLLIGVAVGVYLALNYSIVPKDGAPREAFFKFPEPPGSSFASNGKYEFKAGEKLRYRLNARILGSGTEQSNDPMNIALDFAADMGLDTRSVSPGGDGELELRFNRVEMDGQFMGSPVRLLKTAEARQFEMPGLADVNRSRGVPQLEFFETPIQMRVSSDGRVKDVRGVEGFEQILTQVPVMTSSRMPDASMKTGESWESQFNLPVPGIGTAPAARAINTKVGEETLHGRRCAVIRQRLDSQSIDGQINSPESMLGEAMSFSMPKFLLNGDNTLYYDLATGHLVQADLDLHFGLEIGKELQGATQLLGIYSNLLNDIEGGGGNTKLQIDHSKNTMELGVGIKGRLALEN